MLVDTFINAIFLYDDKVVITFNYSEGGKTITHEDVTSSGMDLAGEPGRVIMKLIALFLYFGMNKYKQ